MCNINKIAHNIVFKEHYYAKSYLINKMASLNDLAIKIHIPYVKNELIIICKIWIKCTLHQNQTVNFIDPKCHKIN